MQVEPQCSRDGEGGGGEEKCELGSFALWTHDVMSKYSCTCLRGQHLIKNIWNISRFKIKSFRTDGKLFSSLLESRFVK